mmetsp:Transcript_70574/g.125641  ORF Transcript_70574/g.125641 Transcript_70574/m.125641 type:complete len:415 (+) Transcript_70574:84-1328(+)
MSETDALLQQSPEGEINDLLGACTLTVFAGGLYILGAIPSTLPVFTEDKIAEDPHMENFNEIVVSRCLSCFWIGWSLASVTILPMCDRVGRRTPMYILLAAGLVAGWSGTLATTAFPFALSIFFTGFCLPPSFQIGYLLLCESIPERWCANITVVLNLGFSLGIVAMAGICRVAQHVNWRKETFCWYVPFLFLLVFGPWFVRESPKFIAASKVARVATLDPGGTGGVFEILCQPGLLRRVVTTTMCWMTCSMAFYGLSFVSGNLSEDLYTNMMLMGCVDLVGYLVPAPIMACIGPVRAQVASFFFAALVLLTCGLFKPGPSLLTLALLGRLAIDVAFTTIYVLLFETFPDECRSSAMGIANVFARAASLVTPMLSSVPAAVSCPLLGLLSFVAAFATMDLQHTMQQEKGAEFDS